MMSGGALRAVIAAALLVAGTAAATENGHQSSPKRSRFAPNLIALSVGGGASEFINTSYRSRTAPAGAWDVRLTIGTRTPLAFEVAYVGTAQAIRDPFGHGPVLSSNSVEADLRLNLKVWRLQPFIVAGVGWINFHSYGREHSPIAAAEFNNDANALVVPMGAGLAAYIGKHAMIDARFTYRLIPETNLTPDLTDRPDNWTAMLRAGYAF